MVKYLFLLLLLTVACTAPKTETKQEAIAEAPRPAAETNQPPASVTEPKILPYPSKAWEEISNIVEFVDDGTYHDDPSYEEENPEFVYIDEDAIYVTNTNPYKDEYDVFFNNQLAQHGKDPEGRRIVNYKDLMSFESNYPPLD